MYHQDSKGNWHTTEEGRDAYNEKIKANLELKSTLEGEIAGTEKVEPVNLGYTDTSKSEARANIRANLLREFVRQEEFIGQLNKNGHEKTADGVSINDMQMHLNKLAQLITACDASEQEIIPRPKQYAKYEKKAFTPEQEAKFIELCLKDLDKYESLLICVLQGIRKGEMLALRPNDLNFKEKTLRIDESYDINYPDDLETKNQASKRTMPMFDLTRQLLLKYKDTEPTKRIYEHINGTTLNLWLAKLLKKNELPKMTLHELRHTFITRCHEKGIDELIIQKWVGHAKGSRMTKAVYTHINDENEMKSIELLNKKTA